MLTHIWVGACIYCVPLWIQVNALTYFLLNSMKAYSIVQAIAKVYSIWKYSSLPWNKKTGDDYGCEKDEHEFVIVQELQPSTWEQDMLQAHPHRWLLHPQSMLLSFSSENVCNSSHILSTVPTLVIMSSSMWFKTLFKIHPISAPYPAQTSGLSVSWPVLLFYLHQNKVTQL